MVFSANPDVVDLYVLSWRSERTAVVAVSTLEEAAHLLRDRAISAVVLDVSSPAVDWDVCRRLVAEGEKNLPVVVLTGWIDPETRDRALACGCAAFVAKPASPIRLGEILQRARAGERDIIAVP